MASTLTNANNVILNTYLVESFTRTTVQASAAGSEAGTTTIYTVPAGKTLYITDMSIFFDNNIGTEGFTVNLLVGTVPVWGAVSGLTTSGARQHAFAWSPSKPIIATTGQTVQLQDVANGGGSNARAAIMGFLV